MVILNNYSRFTFSMAHIAWNVLAMNWSSLSVSTFASSTKLTTILFVKICVTVASKYHAVKNSLAGLKNLFAITTMTPFS